MEEIKKFIITNFTEDKFIIMIAIGLFLVGLSILIPSGRKLFKIDLIRMANGDYENLYMSKKMRYLHNLSEKSILKGLYLKVNSPRYQKYEQKIKDAGGLNGLSVDVVMMIKYYSLFIGLLITSFIAFTLYHNGFINIFGFISMDIMLSLVSFFIPDFILYRIIKKRQRNFLSELDKIELFTIVFMKAGYNVYDILLIMKDITKYTSKYFEECANEYYIRRNVALQKMADKIHLEEYQLLIDILKQANDVRGKDMVDFIDSHMNQLKKMRQLEILSENKKKPVKYVFVLMIPFFAIIILWIYPLLTQALNSFTSLIAY